MVFAGTAVTRGRGTALVVATGDYDRGRADRAARRGGAAAADAAAGAARLDWRAMLAARRRRSRSR